MNKPLTTILITRPMGQQQAFATCCADLGLEVSHLPCLSIETVPNQGLSLKMLNEYNGVFFTSKNAVSHAHRLCPLPWLGVSVSAIGPATSAALAALNQAVELTAKPPFTSESYLHQMDGLLAQKLLIIKGSGGRTLIADRLREIGWHVQTIDVYRRALPVISAAHVAERIQCPTPDIISINSNETLQNLRILAANQWDTLCELPLIVNSERTAELAMSMGFKLPALVASKAGDEGQLEQLKRWMANR